MTVSEHHDSIDDAIATLNDSFVDWQLRANPLVGAVYGLKRYDDQVFDVSKAFRVALVSAMQQLLEKAKSVGNECVTEKQRNDVQFLCTAIDQVLLREGVPGVKGYALELENSHLGGGLADLILLFDLKPLETKEELENYRTRLSLLPVQFDHMIENFESGIARKITLNRASTELLIRVCKDLCGDGMDPLVAAKSSALNRPERAKILVGDEDFLVDVLLNRVLPGIGKIKSFLETVYLPHARVTDGLSSLPDAHTEYENYLLQFAELPYTAEEIHQIGLEEVSRIELLLERAKKHCGYFGTVPEFQRDLLDRTKFPFLYFDTRDEILEECKELIRDSRLRMVNLFNEFPKFDCGVKPVPAALELQFPIGSYSDGTETSGGTFLINLRLQLAKPSHQLKALCLHEANPGHHHQTSLATHRSGVHLIRRMASSGTFVEGWGLYSEFLGEELGLYTDPFEYFGRLETELFRALRMVVDTGLHSKNWTIRESVDYMASKIAFTRAELETEVVRYTAIPGQAVSYKCGELKIHALRRFAEKELRGGFDIKEFHGVVLGSGAVSMKMLEGNVHAWVKRKKEEVAQVRIACSVDARIEKLNDLFVGYTVRANPLTALMFGIRKHENEIFDVSREFHWKMVAWMRALKKQVSDVEGMDGLTGKQKEDIVFLKAAVDNVLLTEGIPGEEGYFLELSNNHFYGELVSLEELFSLHPLDTVQDLLHYRNRLSCLPKQFRHMIDNFRSGINRKITLNKTSIDLLIDFCDSFALLDQPGLEAARKCALNRPEQAKKLMANEDYLVPLLKEQVIPGVRQIREFMSTEYLPHARATDGIVGLENATHEYENYILLNTEVPVTADEMHERGLKEVARIERLMQESKNQCGFNGTVKEFQRALLDPEQYPGLYLKKEEVVPEAERLVRFCKAKMGTLFNRFPKFDCKVKPYPESLEKQAPLGSYELGSGEEGGTFSINTYLQLVTPKNHLMTLCAHEANPGHHHQISLSSQNAGQHMIRRMISSMPYSEGWGLYSEFLGEEMGLFVDPFDMFGRLEDEMLRAIRLVVDTGLHSKGWTLDQTVAYMTSYLGHSPAEILSEARRYAVYPGQALAYKTGEMKFKELRLLAKAELGDAFDVKQFHEVVLGSGALPMAMVEAVVEAWIEESKNRVVLSGNASKWSSFADGKKDIIIDRPSEGFVPQVFEVGRKANQSLAGTLLLVLVVMSVFSLVLEI
ncbi:hypothetical protein HDU98_009862 [Podochytrium sp. JEL0797]|nr:hypothetical protein HDU98_009862 [Podochytrium sp. JEL0797]